LLGSAVANSAADGVEMKWLNISARKLHLGRTSRAGLVYIA
jgi:hypothetical protein